MNDIFDFFFPDFTIDDSWARSLDIARIRNSSICWLVALFNSSINCPTIKLPVLTSPDIFEATGETAYEEINYNFSNDDFDSSFPKREQTTTSNLVELDYINTKNKMQYSSQNLPNEDDIRKYSIVPYSSPMKPVDNPHAMLFSASPPEEHPQVSAGLNTKTSFNNDPLLRSGGNPLERGKMQFSADGGGGDARQIKKRRKTTATTTVSPANRKKVLRKRKVTKTTASSSSTRRMKKRKRTTVSTDS